MNQYLITGIGNEKFAFNIKEVKEIITYKEVSKVPHSNENIFGVIKLREKIISVFLPTYLFNVDFIIEEECIEDYKIIICEDENDDFGIIVNRVFNVENINDIQSVPVVNGESTFVSGIYIKDSEIISIIDLGNLEYLKSIEINN